MTTSIELTVRVSRNRRNGIDSCHLRKRKPPSQFTITFLELHNTAWALVISRQVESCWINWIRMKETGIFFSILFSGLCSSEVSKLVCPVGYWWSIWRLAHFYAEHLDQSVLNICPVYIFLIVEVVFFVIIDAWWNFVNWNYSVARIVPKHWSKL